MACGRNAHYQAGGDCVECFAGVLIVNGVPKKGVDTPDGVRAIISSIMLSFRLF